MAFIKRDFQKSTQLLVQMSSVFANHQVANASNAFNSTYVKSKSTIIADRGDSAAYQMGVAMSDEAFQKYLEGGLFEFAISNQLLGKDEYPPLGSQTARTGPSTSLPVQVLAAPSSTSPTTSTAAEAVWPSSAFQAEWDTKVLDIIAICGTDDFGCIEGMAWSYINKSQEEKDEEAFYIGGKLLEMIH